MAWHKAPDRTASVRCGKGKALSATPLPGLARPQPDLITVFRETKFHFAKIVNQIITKTKTATPPLSRHETKRNKRLLKLYETKRNNVFAKTLRKMFTNLIPGARPAAGGREGGYQMLNHETAHGFTDATA